VSAVRRGGILVEEPLVMLPAVQFDRGTKPLDELLFWLGTAGIPVAKVLCEQSSSVLVVAMEVDVAPDSIPNGTVEEPVCVRITVTVPTKL
jgi:hypothetical protein